MRTEISPRSTLSEAFATPTTTPVFAAISAPRCRRIQRRERRWMAVALARRPNLGAEQMSTARELERGTHGRRRFVGRAVIVEPMASSTITKPASKPMPTCTVRARAPPAPRAPGSHQRRDHHHGQAQHDALVMPARIVGAALGNSTFHSSCMGVAPNAWPASSSALGTELIPSCVSRMGRAGQRSP